MYEKKNKLGDCRRTTIVYNREGLLEGLMHFNVDINHKLGARHTLLDQYSSSVRILEKAQGKAVQACLQALNSTISEITLFY